MAPGRPAARRAMTNENDENAVSTRVTRAKAATLAVQSDSNHILAAKKPLQAKKGALNIKANNETAVLPRKRTALGDVSNVNKGDAAAGSKEVKKIMATNTGSLARAAAPTGIQKASRTNSTRTVVGQKDKPTQDLKRPASVMGAPGNAPKRRITSPAEASGQSTISDTDAIENIEPNEYQTIGVKITETIKVTTRAADGIEIEKEITHEENVLRPSDARVIDHITCATIDEMDQEDENDPLMVSEYVYEILTYMRQLEASTSPNPAYMDHQKHLEWRMRGVLVDWLLEVHTRFHLLPETLYLTINIIDRFLSHKVVQLERLQLVGVTAMFIASKYEEVMSPHISNFRHVADDGFTEEEILSAERYILATLNYDLSFPNPMHFMRRISKADGYDIQTRTLAKYLLEISLLDHRLLTYKPSLNAAAAMHLSRVILGKGSWDQLLMYYSDYTEDDIQPPVHLMIDYLHNPIVHQAFYKKYAGKKFLKASLHARQWAKKWYEDHGEEGEQAKV